MDVLRLPKHCRCRCDIKLIKLSQYLSFFHCTHKNTSGVKRTLVGDGYVAYVISIAAVGEQTLVTVNDGLYQGHGQSDD